eukprot:3487613-Amphidinium_carterae.4
MADGTSPYLCSQPVIVELDRMADGTSPLLCSQPVLVEQYSTSLSSTGQSMPLGTCMLSAELGDVSCRGQYSLGADVTSPHLCFQPALAEQDWWADGTSLHLCFQPVLAEHYSSPLPSAGQPMPLCSCRMSGELDRAQYSSPLWASSLTMPLGPCWLTYDPDGGSMPLCPRMVSIGAGEVMTLPCSTSEAATALAVCCSSWLLSYYCVASLLETCAWNTVLAWCCARLYWYAVLAHAGAAQVYLLEGKWCLGQHPMDIKAKATLRRKMRQIAFSPGLRFQNSCFFACLVRAITGKAPTHLEVATMRRLIAELWKRAPPELLARTARCRP